MRELLIGTNNPNKIREIKNVLVVPGLHLLTVADLADPFEIEETGATFRENALIKAKTLFDRFHIPTIADDSGLEVDALDNRPGVHSQRYSSTGTDEDNLLLLLQEMQGVQNRKARYVCEMVLYQAPDSITFFSGTIEGVITELPIVGNGFGYDPVFYIPSINKRMSECTLLEKNGISHRGQALRKLNDYLEKTS